jgi:4-amino-4-deoxy-L-arabinose transferase-like glycosyltransferase
MATRTAALPQASPEPRHRSASLESLTIPAWISIAIVVAFVLTTCWWLALNHGVPVDDAAVHLGSSIDVFEALRSLHLARAFTESSPYPPLTELVGAVGVFVGGVAIAPPIIALNLFFVPLLALGCYGAGSIAYGRLAGVLAVVFALGAPLVIEEFHEFMLDAPEAAMVAVAVWAILATERFSRVGLSALAGASVGLGMLSKETFAYFVAGVVLVVALQGGRRAWRGLVVFAAVALAIALPWYVDQASLVGELSNEALGSSHHLEAMGIPLGVAPPRLSATNLEWYFWSLVNWQLFLPLFAFSAVGFVWTVVRLIRRQSASGAELALVIGALVSWVALTETFVHDPRYSLPLMIYLAVFGAGWVTRLAGPARVVLASVLMLVAITNSLGVSFGAGASVMAGSGSAVYEQQPGAVTFASNHGLWIGAPIRGGDVLGLLRALRRSGVREVRWYSEDESTVEYSYPGIAVLAQIAGLRVPARTPALAEAGPRFAVLAHGRSAPGLPSPCIELSGDIGVWVTRGGTPAAEAWRYCPA